MNKTAIFQYDLFPYITFSTGAKTRRGMVIGTDSVPNCLPSKPLRIMNAKRAEQFAEEIETMCQERRRELDVIYTKFNRKLKKMLTREKIKISYSI